jgi:hypothetical protein
LVFNGGLEPRGQSWLERKYPGVRVIELPVPEDWNIREEFHFFDFVSTQLSLYVETDCYVKMDRDVFVLRDDVDVVLEKWLADNPGVAAAGTLALCERNIELDSAGFFDWLSTPVSFAETPTLNGGVELFRTADVRAVAPLLRERGRRIWAENLRVGEDDLVSMTLAGTGRKLADCPLLRSYGMVDFQPFAAALSEPGRLAASLSTFGEAAIVHGFKPYYLYRPLYLAVQRELLRDDTPVERRSSAEAKDIFCAARLNQIPYLHERMLGEILCRGLTDLHAAASRTLRNGGTVAQLMSSGDISISNRVSLSQIVCKLAV